MLPSGDDDDGDGAVPPNLNVLLPGVSRPGGLAPPSPAGNTPPHNPRSDRPAADVLRDALVRYLYWLLPEQKCEDTSKILQLAQLHAGGVPGRRPERARQVRAQEFVRARFARRHGFGNRHRA